jgi:hypothetical protein
MHISLLTGTLHSTVVSMYVPCKYKCIRMQLYAYPVIQQIKPKTSIYFQYMYCSPIPVAV